MNARLCSMLVAGGFAVMAPQAIVRAATPGSEHPVQGVTLHSIELSDSKILLGIPGFKNVPKLQVLSSPDRVVVDLPGVVKGNLITRKDLAAIQHEGIVRARVAQFAIAPEPVTRLVLDVKPGVQVVVSPSDSGMVLGITQVAGSSIQASYDAASSAVKPMDVELVAAKQSLPAPAEVPAKSEPVAVVASAPVVEVPAPVAVPVAAPAPLAALPTVGSSQSLPAVALSALLPGSTSVQSPSGEARPSQSSGKTGRTLGEGPQKYSGAKMSIDVQGADLVTFLRILADAGKLNLIVDQDVSGTFSFKFTDTPWDQILDVILKHAGLGKEINNGVLRVAKNKRLQEEENERKALDEAKSIAGETQSITRPLSYAKVGEVKPVLEKILTKRGNVITDERTNTLIISDLPKNLPLVDDLLATMDVQIQQVQIEARVVEASDGFTKAFGVKWPTSNAGDVALTLNGKDAPWGFGPSWNSVDLKKDGTSNPKGIAYSGGTAGVTSLASPAGEAWVSFISHRLSVNFILQALEKEGKVKVVSSPKLVTQNNKKAKILSGEKIPYPAIQSGAGGGAITVQFAQANLELNVTPQITSEGTIIMDIQIEKSEADFSRTVNGTPTIIQKAIETQVLVRDGGTAVLGGVYANNKSNGHVGVPFLGRIPILGALFRTTSVDDKTQELLIFITPRILKS